MRSGTPKNQTLTNEHINIPKTFMREILNNTICKRNLSTYNPCAFWWLKYNQSKWLTNIPFTTCDCGINKPHAHKNKKKRFHSRRTSTNRASMFTWITTPTCCSSNGIMIVEQIDHVYRQTQIAIPCQWLHSKMINFHISTLREGPWHYWIYEKHVPTSLNNMDSWHVFFRRPKSQPYIVAFIG